MESEQQAYWFTAFSTSNGTFHRTRTNDLKMWIERLPWWSSGWESTCQCKGHGFNPWSGRIPYAVRQLSPCATTTEAQVPQSLCTSMNSSPDSPQLEKAQEQQQCPSQKKKNLHGTTKDPKQPKQSWERQTKQWFWTILQTYNNQYVPVCSVMSDSFQPHGM